MRSSPRAVQPPALGAVAFDAATILAALLAVLGGLLLARLAFDPAARQALAGLPDHPWWLVYRDRAQPEAPLWALGGAVAGALVAVAGLLVARVVLGRGSSLIAIYAGLFLASLPFECLRGVATFLVAGERSATAALFLTRTVLWARFVGLLSLLGAALDAIDLKERRPLVLIPVVLLVSLVMAAAVPVDRTVWLAQLTFKLGDEQGVWFVTMVIGALVPASLVAGAALRRQARLYRLAAAMALLLGSRELLFYGTQPLRLAAGLVCLAAGTAFFIDTVRRPVAGASPAR